MTEPLARRDLSVAGQREREVTVTLWPPRAATDHAVEWCCRFEIAGLDAPHAADARSLDALGAIINAIAALRTALDASGLSLTWLPGGDGDMGIPLYVPDFGDRELTRSIEAEIERRMRSYPQERKQRAARARRNP